MRAILAAALLLLSTHAAAINKCVGPDGKVFYQDTLCPNEGGKSISATPNSVSRTDAERQAAKGIPTEAQRKEQAAEAKALAAQEEHAKMIQRKAQADERAQATKNSKTRSTIHGNANSAPSRVVTCCK
jgi:hypothetical protein